MCAQDCTASSVASELGDFQFKNRLKIETETETLQISTRSLS